MQGQSSASDIDSRPGGYEGRKESKMKKWRIIYWFGSITTEVFIEADSKEDATAEFEKRKGKDTIINIEEA